MEPLHYLLMKAHTNLNRHILAQAAGIGLSPGQPKVLECLRQLGQSNQRTIASFCEIEPATVGSILSRMERDGLICRVQQQDDRRAISVSLTPRGQALSQQLEDIFVRSDEAAARLLTPEEQQTLCSLLRRVCAALDDGEEGRV